MSSTARSCGEPIQLEDGYLTPPDRPGLGIELDPAVVERHLA